MSEQVTASTPTTPSPTPIYPRMLVRHFGLNRADRHRYRRIAASTPGGSKENLEARRLLKKSPRNFPVRKVLINSQITLMFEPQYQELRAESLKQLKASVEAHTRANVPEGFEGSVEGLALSLFNNLKAAGDKLMKPRRSVPSFTFVDPKPAEANA